MLKPLLTGFARGDITPEVGVELCGFGWNIGRVSTGIESPLYANVMVWQSGEERGAVVSCDLIGIGGALSKAVRLEIERLTGIPYGHILICCTHTHSGPTTMELIGWGEKDEAYLQALPGRIAPAVEEALSALAETEVAYGEAEASGISYNRESHTKHNPGGETDPTLRAVKFLQQGEMKGFFIHYSCHPVVMCEKTSLIGGDFVGRTIHDISEATGAVGLFLQGALGDQNPVYCHEEQELSLLQLRKLAEAFTAIAEQALANARPLQDDSVAAQRSDIALPLAIPDRSLIVRYRIMIADMAKHMDELPEAVRRRVRFERDVLEQAWLNYDKPRPDELDTELFVLRIGGILLAAHPSELFYAYHKEIVDTLKPNPVLVIGMANDAIGYLPTEDKYDLSGGHYSYPAWFSSFMLSQFPFRADAGKLLTEELIARSKSMLANR